MHSLTGVHGRRVPAGCFEPSGGNFNDSSVAVAAGADFVPGVAQAVHARRSTKAA
jgi:hypothetical protein